MSGQNFEGCFGKSPTPFKIKVDPEFVEFTKKKVNLTRYAVDIDQPDYTDGPPRHKTSEIKDYWSQKYDWEKVQDQLNSQ